MTSRITISKQYLISKDFIWQIVILPTILYYRYHTTGYKCLSIAWLFWRIDISIKK